MTSKQSRGKKQQDPEFPEYHIVNTADLVPYARNARTHTDEQVDQIAASIKEFRFLNPIITDGDHGIVAGHARVMAAQKLGMEKLPAINGEHLSEAQKRAYILADNKLAMNAGWDMELLKVELQELNADQFDIELTGFSIDEFQEMFADEESEEEQGNTDPEEAPEPPAEPVSQAGDIWLLGGHRLMCGDCRNLDSLAALMADQQADMAWTDPPYNIDYEGNAAGKVSNDNLSSDDFRQFLQDSFAGFCAWMKPGACIYITHSELERATFTEVFEQAGFKFAQTLIWVKQAGVLCRQDFNWQHEPILYGWKPGEGHYFCGDHTRTTVIDDETDIESLKKDQLKALIQEIQAGNPSTVIRHDRPAKSMIHPTMKPVGLISRMLKWSSKPNWIVMDLFGGSGSTLIACQKTQRAARLMESDGRYCDATLQRWQDFTGQQATLEATGDTFADVAAARGQATGNEEPIPSEQESQQ